MRFFAQKQNQLQQKSSDNLTRSNASTHAANHEAHPLLHSQRTIGNQAVLRLLRARTDGVESASDTQVGSQTPTTERSAHDFSRIPAHAPAPRTIQAKLAVNTPGDIYEQEADHVAEQVMRMPEPQLQRACACGVGCSSCQTEQPGQGHQRLQTKYVGSSEAGQTAAPPIVHEVLASPGQPLDAATREFFEPRFGHDFSQVRVHSSGAAEQSAHDINAHAYSVGHDIVFGAGRFAPETHDGRRLLAHELTHVVQQSVAGGIRTLSVQRDKAGTVVNDQWTRVVDGYNFLIVDIGMVNQKVMSPTRSDWVNDLATHVAQIGGPGDVDAAALGRADAVLASYKKVIDQNVASARGHWKDLLAEYERERSTLTDGEGSHPRALKFLDQRAKDDRSTVFFAWKYLTFDDMDGLQSMLETKRHLTLVDQQDEEERRRRHKEDSRKVPLFRHFRIRALVGGQISAGPIGADVTTFKIQELGPRGRSGTITFAAEGLAAGLKAGAIGPQSWTEFTTPAEMRIEDFDGAGRMTSAGAHLIYGGGYSVLTFFAGNKPTVEVKSWGHGWGLGGGAETIVGFWTVRSVD